MVYSGGSREMRHDVTRRLGVQLERNGDCDAVQLRCPCGIVDVVSIAWQVGGGFQGENVQNRAELRRKAEGRFGDLKAVRGTKAYEVMAAGRV